MPSTVRAPDFKYGQHPKTDPAASFFQAKASCGLDKAVRTLFSLSIGKYGTNWTFGGVHSVARWNIRLRAAKVRLIVASATPASWARHDVTSA